ncbi:hypothetical protein F2Q68_00019358 [Brassica cretica]|uniref:Uncharacterized protein n=1 Tax=Brassica cretica TaxID=69181 RepID=A0A8S9G0J2_BRACR|nr:hypothetical protein F2Q68_00019358 [Brassica cretica]
MKLVKRRKESTYKLNKNGEDMLMNKEEEGKPSGDGSKIIRKWKTLDFFDDPINNMKAFTGREEDEDGELMAETQPLSRSRIAFLVFVRLACDVKGSPSLTHSSYFSSTATMFEKSGRFEGFSDQHLLIR